MLDSGIQALLPLLDEEPDLAEIMLACLNQSLHKTHIGFTSAYAVSVVLASGGYPGEYEVGKEIGIIPDEGILPQLPFSPILELNDASSDVLFFHAAPPSTAECFEPLAAGSLRSSACMAR